MGYRYHTGPRRYTQADIEKTADQYGITAVRNKIRECSPHGVAVLPSHQNMLYNEAYSEVYIRLRGIRRLLPQFLRKDES